MISTKKVVLETNKGKDFFERFEAIEIIERLSQIQDVWSRNKTPMLSKESVSKLSIASYQLVKVPKELIGDKDAFTDFCHSNGFECGEYRTGVIYDTNEEPCIFCQMAKYKGFSNLEKYNQFVEKPVDCIIYESPSFYVVPELGALKQGFLMIVPKEHILSVAQFPEELMPEYYEVCKDVERILLKAFNGKSVAFMEHGSGPSGKTSHKKSIVHAHTHVVVDFELKEKYQRMVQMKKCEDISEASAVHYFSYQQSTGGQLMIAMDPEVYVQRQFPRQVMAEELGLAPDQYNWRWYEFDEITDATLFHLNNMLRKETSGRIFERTRDFVKGFSRRERKNR